MTLGLSAMKMPLPGSYSRRNCVSVSVPKSSQPGWSRVVISIIGILFRFSFLQIYCSAGIGQILYPIILIKNKQLLIFLDYLRVVICILQ